METARASPVHRARAGFCFSLSEASKQGRAGGPRQLAGAPVDAVSANKFRGHTGTHGW